MRNSAFGQDGCLLLGHVHLKFVLNASYYELSIYLCKGTRPPQFCQYWGARGQGYQRFQEVWLLCCKQGLEAFVRSVSNHPDLLHILSDAHSKCLELGGGGVVAPVPGPHYLATTVP